MVPSNPGGGGGGGGSSSIFRSICALLPTLLCLLLAFPRLAAAQGPASVGYGPLFDETCGDSCQTELLHFCTELRNAQQQHDCWCGAGSLNAQYVSRADACLATCNSATSNIAVQRDQILRYRQVVCKGNADSDPDFEEYYQTRYDGQYTPNPTAAAPPATVTIKVHTTTSSVKSTSSTSSSRSISHTSSPSVSLPSRPTIKTSTTSSSAPTSSSTVATTTSTNSSTLAPPGPKKLSSGSIVGISFGVLAFFTSALLLAAFLVRRRRRLQGEKRISPSPDSYMDGTTYYSPTSPAPDLSPIATKKARFSKAPSPLERRPTQTSHGVRSWLPWNIERASLDIDEITSAGRYTMTTAQMTQYRDSSGTTVGAIRGSSSSLGDRVSMILPPTPGMHFDDDVRVPPLFSYPRPTIRPIYDRQAEGPVAEVRRSQQQQPDYFRYRDEEEYSESDDTCSSWGSQSFVYHEQDEERFWNVDLVTPIDNAGVLR